MIAVYCLNDKVRVRNLVMLVCTVYTIFDISLPELILESFIVYLRSKVNKSFDSYFIYYLYYIYITICTRK